MANCVISTTKSQNRILTWKTEDWKLSGQTTTYDFPLIELCQKNIALNQLIWPRPITFDKFSSYCSLMDGVLPVIYKNSQTQEIYKEAQAIFLSTHKRFPSGFVDKTRPNGLRCFSSEINSDPVIDFWSGMKWNQVARKWYDPLHTFFPHKCHL